MIVDVTSLPELAYAVLLMAVLPLTFTLFSIGLVILKRRKGTELGDVVLLFFFSVLAAGSVGTTFTVLLSFFRGIFPNETLSILVLPSVAGTATFLILSSYAYLDILFDLRK